jgi:hypothetical protein
MAKEKLEMEETIEKVEEQEIKIADPAILRPKELPLVVTLPAGASLAQIEYSKILNAYAYTNPEKWELKKEALIEKLKSLKNAPDPVYDSKVKINNSAI